MRFIKPAAVALAATIAATALVPTADARDRNFYRHGGYHHNHHNGGAAFGAGVAGFAAGAILGSLASQPRYYDYQPGYYSQQPGYYYAPEPVYVAPAPRAYYRGGYNACSGGGSVSRPANALC